MPKILVVAPVHPADDIRVYKKQVISMLNNGFDVTLIARTPWGPYIDSRVDLILVPDFRSRLRRFLYLFKVIKIVLQMPADIIYCHNPDSLPIVFLAKLFGKKVVYDTHENFLMRIRSRLWIPKLLRNLLAIVIHKAEVAASYLVDLMIVTQKPMLSAFNAKKTIVIGNPPLLQNTSSKASSTKPKNENKCPGTVKLGYMGGINREREIEKMIGMLVPLNASGSVELSLIGPVDSAYLAELEKVNGWEYVDFYGKLPQDEGLMILNSVDFGLILLPDIMDFPHTSPNKLFEYATIGLPFIASNFSKWSEVFEGHDCGYFIPYNQQSDIEVIINQFRTCPEQAKTKGECGRLFVKNVFNWSKIEDIYMMHLNDLIR